MVRSLVTSRYPCQTESQMKPREYFRQGTRHLHRNMFGWAPCYKIKSTRKGSIGICAFTRPSPRAKHLGDSELMSRHLLAEGLCSSCVLVPVILCRLLLGDLFLLPGPFEKCCSLMTSLLRGEPGSCTVPGTICSDDPSGSMLTAGRLADSVPFAEQGTGRTRQNACSGSWKDNSSSCELGAQNYPGNFAFHTLQRSRTIPLSLLQALL